CWSRYPGPQSFLLRPFQTYGRLVNGRQPRCVRPSASSCPVLLPCCSCAPSRSRRWFSCTSSDCPACKRGCVLRKRTYKACPDSRPGTATPGECSSLQATRPYHLQPFPQISRHTRREMPSGTGLRGTCPLLYYCSLGGKPTVRTLYQCCG